MKLTEGKDEFGDVDVEIVRTKISEVAYNDTFATDTELICGLISYFFEESEDTEVGLYQVSLVYYDVDEKTGKTKSSNSTIYVPAYSSSEAIENIRTYLKRAGKHVNILFAMSNMTKHNRSWLHLKLIKTTLGYNDFS